MSAETVSFGPFTFHVGTERLFRAGEPVPLGRRCAALLGALVEANEVPVGKDALVARAWPGLSIEVSNLSVQISALRRALGKSPDGQEWIATVPRVGYRLLRGPREATEGELSGPPALAVLPFANMSGGPDQDYFADGVVEDITTALSQFRSFSVVARNSAFAYKGRAVDVRQVGRELGVRYVLEGSVRRASDRLRITAQLLEATTGAHIWAERFDGALDDVFDMQDRITEKVVGVVGPQIRSAEIARSRRKRPDALDAYDLYLQALPKVFAPLPEENAEAYGLLTRALALDPAFAPALVYAAFALEIRHSMGWPALTDDDSPRCLELARRAVASAGDDATVLGQAAIVLVGIGRDYDEALALVDRAVRTNPNNHVALVTAAVTHLHCGSLAETLRLAQRAIALSPNDFGAHWPLTAVAQAHVVLRRYHDAIAWAERSLAANSAFEATYWSLIAAYAFLGRLEEARRYLGKLQAIRPVSAQRIRNGQDNFRDPGRIEVLIEGMALAGLPEQ